jgi:hypothetical protein
MAKVESARISSAESLTIINAFRILGLEVSASPSAVVARTNELQTLLRIKKIPAYPTDIPVFPPPERSPESVAAAAHTLEDPSTRLREEAAWFRSRTPIDTAALAALQENKAAQAMTLWSRAAAQAPRSEDRLHYQHNFAVLKLCLAEMAVSASDATPKAWKEAFSCWAPVLESDEFWKSLIASSPARTDPRCRPATPIEARDLVGFVLAHAVVTHAMRAVNAGEYQVAASWFALLDHDQFPARFLSAAKEEVAESLVESIRTHLNGIDAQLKKGHHIIRVQEEGEAPSSSNASPSDASTSLEGIDAAVENQLSAARTLFDILIAVTSASHPAVLSVTDGLAEAHQFTGVYFGSYRQAPEKGRAIIEAGLRFAASDAVQAALQQNLRVASWNLAFPRLLKALEAKQYAQAETAYRELQTLVDNDEEAALIRSYREPLNLLRLLRDGTPVDKVPSLWRFNGIGTWLYGETDVDAESGTFVSTLYFTFVFIPLFVIARYRISNVGADTYRFYSKLKVSGGQKAWNIAVSVALAAAVIISAASEQPRSRATSSPTSVPSHGSSAAPSPSVAPSAPPASASRPPASSTRAFLAADIDRRRPLLDAEKAQLKAERSAIEQEQGVLASLRERIENRRALYPGGLPPAEYAQ